MATVATRPTRVSGINQMHRDPCPSRLVGDVLAELQEGPGMPLIAMLVSNRCPLSNPTQVFEGECLARDGGCSNQGLRDTVIHIPLKAAFLVRILAQAALGILGVDLLQALAAQGIARTHDMNLYTAEGLPVAIRRQIDDTQVYAKHIISDGEGWRFPPLRQMQRVDASTPHQISAADLPGRAYQHPILPCWRAPHSIPQTTRPSR